MGYDLTNSAGGYHQWNVRGWLSLLNIATLTTLRSRTIINLRYEIASHQHLTSARPGKILVYELEERGIAQSALAMRIGVLSKTIKEICRGKRGISAEMAVKLSCASGASAAFWLNLQKNWELSQVDPSSARKIKPMAA